MLRKYLIPALAVLLILACAFFYFNLRQPKSNTANALTGIPTDAAFVIEVNQLPGIFKRLEESNILWEDLRVTRFFSSLGKDLRFLDSLLPRHSSFQQLGLENHSLYISAHPGKTGSSYLFSYALPDLRLQASLESMLTEKFSVAKGRGAVWAISTEDRSAVCYYAMAHGIAFFSPNEELVNRAVLQSGLTTGLLADKNFERVYVTAKAVKFDLRLFLHYPGVSRWAQPFLGKNQLAVLSSQQDFACWSVTDVTVKPKSLLMNGFTSFLPDSSFLALFKDQQPQHPEALAVMPANTASFFYAGYSDFKTYYARFVRQQSPVEKHLLDSLSQRYTIDIAGALTAWTENEIVSLFTEPPTGASDLSENTFCIIRSSNPGQEELTLQALCDKACKTDNLKNDTVSYGTHMIRHLPVRHILSLVYGSVYPVTENYFIREGNYFIFGNSVEGLKNYLHYTDHDHTLLQDSHFNEFSANLASSCNVFFYSNIARSRPLYESLASEALQQDIRKQGDLLIRFEAAAVQFSGQGDLFYQTAYLEENPIYKKETATLWESRLDTSFHLTPRLLLNHLTNTLDILVQDDANKVYLLSSTGKIIWTRQLPEKIISDVVQVDAFKNKKLQMLFNTRSGLYLIDRTGKDVEGFPVTLPAPATNGLTLLDYDHSLDYRILIATTAKHLLNYTIRGKQTEGWHTPETNDTVNAPILHAVSGRKDFLFLTDVQGNVLIFDRHGEKRMEMPAALPKHLHTFRMEGGKDLAHVQLIAADSLGNVTRITPDNKKEHLSFLSSSAKTEFLYQDMNGDQIPEFIFLSENQLHVFTADKSLLFSYLFSDSITQAPFYLQDAEGHGRIGVVSDRKEEIYLFNESGKLPEGFPLRGTKAFVIGDLNRDNTMQLITGDGKNIYAYTIP
jgi:hypothetical protein